MGKVAFVFPGQGAQKVGMGREAFDAEPASRAVFEEADAALGFALTKLCFEGPDTDLALTANTQPAILTTSIALWKAFGEKCDVVAGHSLGEYSANVAAGTFAFKDAVKIVRARGQYMQEAVPVGVGAMAAVMGAAREIVDEACAQNAGVVEAVNYNSPGQIVIAGEAAAVAEAGEALKAQGGKVIPLAVSAPFHSSLMRPAEERLRPHLQGDFFTHPKVPVYVNVDAAPLTTGSAVMRALAEQVSRPVRWEESVERMIHEGVTLFIEIGPGKVLTGLIGRIDKRVAKASVQSPADFDAARALIRAHAG